MKQLSIFKVLFFVGLISILSGFQRIETANELGELIFESIKNQDQEKLLSLMITENDIIESIDSSNITDSLKPTVRMVIISKLLNNKEKTKNSIIFGYNEILKDLKEKKCKENVQIGKININTEPLKNLPFEIGTIEIEYLCSDQRDIMIVNIIKTHSGWNILENLRIKGKNE